jgi:hypothetical protein
LIGLAVGIVVEVAGGVLVGLSKLFWASGGRQIQKQTKTNYLTILEITNSARLSDNGARHYSAYQGVVVLGDEIGGDVSILLANMGLVQG